MRKNSKVSQVYKLLRKRSMTRSELMALGIRNPEAIVYHLKKMHGCKIDSVRIRKRGVAVRYVYRHSAMPVGGTRALLTLQDILSALTPGKWYTTPEATALVSHLIPPEAAFRRCKKNRRENQNIPIEQSIAVGRRRIVMSQLCLGVLKGKIKKRESTYKHSGPCFRFQYALAIDTVLPSKES